MLRNQLRTAPFLLPLFGLFLTLGNLPRFLPLHFFPSHISLLELLLYVASLHVLWIYRSNLGRFCWGPALIGLSACYGIILNGWDPLCILYPCRLAMMLLTGWAIGQCLAVRFGPDLQQLCNWVVTWYGLHLLLGFAIFFLFPRTDDLFLLLQGWGIRMRGDPHYLRFISPYLDPNYFAAVGGIPLLLMRYSGRVHRFLKPALWAGLFLSFSRSGLTALLFWISVIVLRSRFSSSLLRFTPFLFILLILLLSLVYPESSWYFWNRMVHFLEDPSAYCRFFSLREGWERFLQAPFFGWGMHYSVQPELPQLPSTHIDSSLLVTLADCGLIPCLLLLIAALCWTYNRFSLYRRRDSFPFFFDLFAYVIVILLFASFFNNILYYPFWLIPIVALFVYLDAQHQHVEAIGIK